MLSVLLSIFPFALSENLSEKQQVFHNDMLAEIASVNSAKLGWTAGINTRFDNFTWEDARALMGVNRTAIDFRLPLKQPEIRSDIPENWNSTQEFPHCPSIADVWDQSACASCYVLATVMSAADRLCIATNGSKTQRISAEHMLGCCHTCGNGCGSGFPPYAWAWMKTHGVVSGGPYGSTSYCSAYSLKPCEHHTTGKYPTCGSPDKTPACPTTCDKGTSWGIPFPLDLVKFKSSYQLPTDDASIQSEIMTHGSVTAEMNVYSDFLTYKGGVYRAQGGTELGGHAVRIMGWGTEDSQPYWLVANSWNTDWGVNGFFKIVRGNCGINRGVYGGEYN